MPSSSIPGILKTFIKHTCMAGWHCQIPSRYMANLPPHHAIKYPTFTSPNNWMNIVLQYNDKSIFLYLSNYPKTNRQNVQKIIYYLITSRILHRSLIYSNVRINIIYSVTLRTINLTSPLKYRSSDFADTPPPKDMKTGSKINHTWCHNWTLSNPTTVNYFEYFVWCPIKGLSPFNC